MNHPLHTRMTDGGVFRSLLLYSLPLIAGNMMQQLYNTCDSIIVGNLVGSHALAAVGASGQIIYLLTTLCIGASTGAGILIATFYGAEDERQTGVAVHTSLVLSALGMGVMNLYFGTGRYKLDLLAFYFRDLELVLLNVLPFALLILLLWALTNRAWIAFLGTGVFTLIYSWAEYWKLMGRSDPIIAEDLTILSEGLQMGGSYITVTWQIVLSALLVLAGTLVFFFFLRGRLPRPLPRLGLAALVIAASWLLYTQVYTDYYRYKRYPTWEKLNKWVESQKFISRGCLYPFLYSTKELGEKPPEGYSAAEAEALLRSYPSDDIPPERRLNVIVVMYEAFADLSQCTDRITAAAYVARSKEHVRLLDERHVGPRHARADSSRHTGPSSANNNNSGHTFSYSTLLYS